VADDCLHQPVQMEAVGERRAREYPTSADGVGECVGVGTGCPQRLVQEVGVLTEQGQRDVVGLLIL
jgi:hypothetical protein